jgi:hypothetical protein
VRDALQVNQGNDSTRWLQVRESRAAVARRFVTEAAPSLLKAQITLAVG